MTRARLFIIAGLAAMAAAAVFLSSRMQAPAESTPVAVADVPVTDSSPIPVPASPAPPAADPSVRRNTLPRDPMAATFEASDDLLAFIDGIHGAAQLGDGPAAFFVYRAMYRCRDEYGKYFGPGRHERALDDVLADLNLVRMYGEEEIRRIHSQCQRLRETDLARFGEMNDWLTKSADAGYARGQAEWAFRLAHGHDQQADSESLEKARELARAAMTSKDPAVFVPVGSVIGVLTGESGNMVREASWFLAACRRGADCGPRSEMTRLMCRFDSNCQPYESGLDLLRRLTGNDFEAIERGAIEINDAIDAGNLEVLGL